MAPWSPNPRRTRVAVVDRLGGLAVLDHHQQRGGRGQPQPWLIEAYVSRTLDA